VLGLLLTAAFQIALAAAPGIFLAALAAVTIGLAFEIYEPPSQALVADVVEEDGDRVTAYGLYSLVSTPHSDKSFIRTSLSASIPTPTTSSRAVWGIFYATVWSVG
jgi:hypothetical protein